MQFILILTLSIFGSLWTKVLETIKCMAICIATFHIVFLPIAVILCYCCISEFIKGIVWVAFIFFFLVSFTSKLTLSFHLNFMF